MFDPKKLRDDFPILNRTIHGKPLVYLDNAATTQKPRQVIDALVKFYERHNANVHRGVHTLSDEATQAVEDARKKVASFINAPKPETVIFTRNATESINLVAYAWGRKFLAPQDEILLTEMEHHSNLVPWQMLCQEKGVRLRFIPVLPDGTLDAEAAAKIITPKTKLVAFTAASNALGTLNPVDKIIAAARGMGAKVLIDAAQWAPHFTTDVRAWDADFVAFSAHKMLGPTGVGVLWGKEDLLDSMNPFLGGGDMIRQVFLERSSYNVLPHKFEAGTPNIADTVAFGAAIDYLNALGMDDVRAHERELTRKALALFKQFEGDVTVYGPQDVDQRGGVISFNINGIHAHDIGTSFDLDGVAVRVGHHCCMPLWMKLKAAGSARASFYVYNTDEDVEVLGRSLKKTVEFFKKPTGVR